MFPDALPRNLQPTSPKDVIHLLGRGRALIHAALAGVFVLLTAAAWIVEVKVRSATERLDHVLSIESTVVAAMRVVEAAVAEPRAEMPEEGPLPALFLALRARAGGGLVLTAESTPPAALARIAARAADDVAPRAGLLVDNGRIFAVARGGMTQNGLVDLARIAVLPLPALSEIHGATLFTIRAGDRPGVAGGTVFPGWNDVPIWIEPHGEPLFDLRDGIMVTCLGGLVLATLAQLVYSIRQRRSAATVVATIEARAYDRATRDPLTGLHNRSGFALHLGNALRERPEAGLVGVIFVDLDRFKEVNDSYGHEKGDQLLLAVSDRLRAQTADRGLIARLGGDEFAIVLPNPGRAEAVVELGQAICAEIGRPFQLSDIEVVIGASVGVAVAPEDGTEQSVLVRRADISMYRSKTNGRGQCHRFHSSMEDEVRKRKEMEGQLRHAIERDELALHYQPFYSTDGETVIGVEALMRWTRKEGGPVSPGVFIPLAEETGLIVELSDWAMNRAMADMRQWPDLTLALNVSPVQFRLGQALIDGFAKTAEQFGLPTSRIEVEITEGVLMEDEAQAVKIIEGFRNAGFRVALDDFGTGFASLSYLRNFRFDKLKIDQAFVRNLNGRSGAATIIHSVVSMGRSLGMMVQAEGVETLEHHIFLRAAGCHYLQGYYFSKPLPIDALAALLEKSQGTALRFDRKLATRL